MAGVSDGYPVDENITVLAGRDIYKSSEWWKAAVYYEYPKKEGDPEVGIYLWHLDDETDDWNRKNKYTVKTVEAWEKDRPIIDSLLVRDTPETGRKEQPTDVPVSDYYTVGEAYTIFRSEDWWKAIVRITAKGNYNTEEVIVYLWQNTEYGWQRRQKYAIKDNDDWETECGCIESLFQVDASSMSKGDKDNSQEMPPSGSTESISDSLDALNEKLKEEHLSAELRE